jgi:single-stranded-DNA-specific exonuclease
MATAVARLASACANGEAVCVYGDYDVDGITSVALLISFFRKVGISCFYHIPRRLEHGYGISSEALDIIASQGGRIVVSVDCGVTAVDEARHAAELGIDLIITDHHTPGETLPDAFAVINPLLPGSGYPFNGLAGVGVAFNLLVALRRKLRDGGVFSSVSEPDLRDYLDLVALGTIADLVPLRDQNRILVKSGLKALETSNRPGIIALKDIAAVSGEVSCSAVGFRLAPRINAAGRLEDAALGVELLLTDDPVQARTIAAGLDANNAERQALEKEILASALRMIATDAGMNGRSSIVLASPEWHQGVIGIVASRIVDLYHRPTVLIALEEGAGRGSGRSIPGFHLYQALQACTDHLQKFGGHRQAAGLSINESTLAAFVARFDEVAAGSLGELDLIPELLLDCELQSEELTIDLARSIEALQPFGMGNPEPLFLLRNMRVADAKVLKGAHRKLVLESSGCRIDAIAFGMADRQLPDCIDVAAQLQINIWNNRTSLQLQIKDFRETD